MRSRSGMVSEVAVEEIPSGSENMDTDQEKCDDALLHVSAEQHDSDEVDIGNLQPTILTDETTACTTRPRTGDVSIHSVPQKCSWRLITRLAGIYAAMIPCGMSHAVIGAILLELGSQTGADVQKLSLLFTWNFTGRLLSSLTVSSIFDKFHPEMQLGIVSLLFVVSIFLIPITSSYAVVAGFSSMLGFCNGYLTMGSTSSVFWLLKDTYHEPGPFIQANYFTMGLGSFLAPLVAKPFLSKYTSNTSKPVVDEQLTYNLSSINSSELNVVFGIIERGTFYPMMILCVLQAIPTILFWIQFSTDHFKPTRPTQTQARRGEKSRINIVIIILLFIAFYCALGIEVTFSGLLYTYAVIACHWGVKQANYLITLFWALYTISRALSIFISKYLHPKVILAVLIPMVVGLLVLMSFGTHLSPVVLWLVSAGIAMSCSLQVGTWFLLGNEYFPITGRLVGLFMTAVYIGGMTVPPVTGYLFKNVDPRWMPYLLLGLSIMLLAVYIIIHVVNTRATSKVIVIDDVNDVYSTDEEIIPEHQHKLMYSSLTSLPM